MRGVFVTGTDTEVGKTVLAAAITAAAVERGMTVAAFKPVVTGLDEPATAWPRDHELLAQVANAGQSAEDVAPHRYGPAVSPHLAGQLANEQLVVDELVAQARAEAAKADALVVEGVGGLLVPLAPEYLVRDFAGELSLPLVIAARPGLGTISHSLLTIEAARAVALRIQAVVLTPWPEEPSRMERSNMETIEHFGEVPVIGLPRTEPAKLAEAGAALPVSDWLSP
ncbi:MAG TPA: dethiobiotin synthase [Thermoleophilaceae bacterium]|jgi:dethiobiotin synthetase|nr:dethiobiotin synthase [Thermoleophilaceae bacterium]